MYGKDCNYLDPHEDKLIFYSRDYCHNISFEELLKWYIKRIDCVDADEGDEDYLRRIDNNLNNLIEFIKVCSK